MAGPDLDVIVIGAGTKTQRVDSEIQFADGIIKASVEWHSPGSTWIFIPDANSLSWKRTIASAEHGALVCSVSLHNSMSY